MQLFMILIALTLCVGCQSKPVLSTHSPSSLQPDLRTHVVVTADGKVPTTETVGVSDFEGSTYLFESTKAILDKTPRWKDGEDFPPLPPRKAETVARKEAQRLRPDVNSWGMDSIQLNQINHECWCYVIRLYRTDIAITGLPYEPYLDVPVLMDGQAVRGRR
jgi:hypothetical protein